MHPSGKICLPGNDFNLGEHPGIYGQSVQPHRLYPQVPIDKPREPVALHGVADRPSMYLLSNALTASVNILEGHLWHSSTIKPKCSLISEAIR